MTRLYLAGPMTGIQDLNYPLFHAEAFRLRTLGYEVANPAENPEPPCGTWQGYMRMAIAQLVTCDTIALLPDWQDSRGTMVELGLSHKLGLRIVCAREVTA